MKIIISPSKTMKKQKYTCQTQLPLFNEQAKYLKDIIIQYNIDELMTRFHISEKLALSLHQQLQDNSLQPALFFYTGTVFKQLQLQQYNNTEFDYIKTHLNILDAMYGVLNYNDLISFYRLDFLTELDFNLYDYWKNLIHSIYENEECIINLASNEFSKMISHPNMITIDFCIEHDSKIKRPSMLVKKARGMMLNEMIKHQINDLEILKKVTFDGYRYDSQLSTSTNYVFIKH